MDNLSPLHHLNPYSHQNPKRNHMLPKSLPPPSISLPIPDAHFPPSSPFQFSPPKVSPFFHPFDEFNELTTLNSVKEMHAQMVKNPKNVNFTTIDGTVMRNYLEFGDFVSAIKVFFVGFARNYLLYHSFVEEFESFGGDPSEILVVFNELHSKGVEFDSIAFTFILKICMALKDLCVGLEIHACLIKKGFHDDVHLNCALINFYEKCWSIDKANQVFYETPNQEDFLWNTIVMANLRSEKWKNALELFGNMQRVSAKATSGLIVKMLQACGKFRALDEGKQLHGLSSWNSIISSYTVGGCLSDAFDIFAKEMECSGIKPDIITWNSVLLGYVLQGSFEMVLTSFRSLCNAGFKPDSYLVTSALKAVIELGFFKLGKEIHGYIMKSNLNCDVYVCTTLVDMYVKNDCLEKAHAVFRHAKNKNVCTWNSLISGYSYKGLFGDAEKLLNQMEEEGIKPDLVTWNCLVPGYSMRGRIEEALAVMNQIKSSGITPNVVSWTALISGCSQNGKYTDALKVFSQMQAENVKPNLRMICSLLCACAGLSLLKKGEEIHCFSMKLEIVDDMYVATALIDMYSKAGKLEVANNVFSKIQEKTLPCWNCMMMGYAIHGHGEEVMILYDKMRDKCIRPDAITFTALLSGCKNSGLVDEGWKYFDSMQEEYNIIPTIEHYCCMVDLLGKAGFLDKASDFIKTMPIKPDASIWGALLTSCRIHKNIKLAEVAAEKLFKMEPKNSANYVLMMNLYSSLNQWDDVERLKRSMIDLAMKSPPVWSWTQVNQSIHVFSTYGKPHPEEGEIYFELYRLISEIRNLGYVADLNCVCQNTDDNEKEKVLLSHTEKLAMVYGVMKTKGGSPIRVVKNTRICSDCHTVAKYISLARNCEILLRDYGRFHHFKDGKCACNDCW
ncbi:unnamed protein product [Vicia faba]|uniref:DYW domain-containing protein n=1 Tax=Vicia faba TaxID=3906 RepID=A0AAV1ADC5_VICFA|nr:unnamed protein product [Vicia faba]